KDSITISTSHYDLPVEVFFSIKAMKSTLRKEREKKLKQSPVKEMQFMSNTPPKKHQYGYILIYILIKRNLFPR
uniref:hypothetical protein n=1 Tax=Salmonella sp. s58760 TaxID=3159708 RepID=UPI00397FEA04